MGAKLPNLIQKMFDSEKDEFSSIAQANWQKLAALIEYLNKSYPVGMLLFMDLSQDQLPNPPNPKYWKFCDGSMIVNPDSPFNGQMSPDLRGRFIRNPDAIEAPLTLAGSNSIQLSHNHSGVTGFGFDANGLSAKNGSDPQWQPSGYHQHGVASSMGFVSTVAKYRHFEVYMRIV